MGTQRRPSTSDDGWNEDAHGMGQAAGLLAGCQRDRHFCSSTQRHTRTGLTALIVRMLPLITNATRRRLLEPIGHVPPAEAEAAYYAAMEEPAKIAA